MSTYRPSMGTSKSTWFMLESSYIRELWHRSRRLLILYRHILQLVSSNHFITTPHAAAKEGHCNGHLQLGSFQPLYYAV